MVTGIGTASFGAALAQLHAAARLVLEAEYEEAGEHAMTASMLAGSGTGHLGALARTMHGVNQLYVADGAGMHEDLVESVQFLLRSGAWVPGSPELAYVVGAGLARAGLFDLVRRWAAMIVDGADTASSARLRAASLFLSALCAVDDGRFREARSQSHDAARLAVATGFDSLAVRASSASGLLDLLIEDPRRGSDSSARILPAALGAAGGLQAESQIAMALSELIAGDRDAAAAWLRSAFDSFSDQSLTLPLIDHSVALMAVLLLLTDWPEAAVRLLGVTGPNGLERSVRGPLCALLRGISEENPSGAVERLERAVTDPAGSRLVRSLASMAKGVRLLHMGEGAASRAHLEDLAATFGELGLGGLVHVLRDFLDRAASSGAPRRNPTALPAGHGHGEPGPPCAGADEEVEPSWHVTLLGDFCIEFGGERFDLPESVSTRALKLVAVRRRVTIDELVDVLWPECDHEVGSRRLRNVLWRIRSACGDLLHRDGNLICLSSSVRTDVEEFERLASLALSADTPTEAGRVAARALALYAGPLLPGDLFVDWTAPHRESLALVHLRLLDHLLGRALDEDRVNDALTLLERMIEAEPFEETYYIQAAELYARSGRLQRARMNLERARRMLLELGLEPSAAHLQVCQRLSRVSA